LKPSGFPRAVRDLLPDAVPLLAGRLAQANVHQAWETAVGSEVARRARPGPLVEGCLTVIVDNSPWLHELRLRQPEVLAAIQLHCPSIRALRLAVGSLGPGEASAGASPPPALSEREQREIEEAAAGISDAALAAAARRLLGRARAAGPREVAP
jgi:hypothetical protein